MYSDKETEQTGGLNIWLIFTVSLLVGFCLARVHARISRKPLELAYSEKSPIMVEFVEKSRIRQMVYEPYTFALGQISHSICYVLWDLFCRSVFRQRFVRETIVLDDGGTVALDWDQVRPNPIETPEKPYLLMIPGVAGASDNLYSMELQKAVRHKYQVATLVFRGSDGLPLTSPKLNHMGMWDDIKQVLEHLDKTYVGRDSKGNKRTRMYAYGCSLGGSMLGLYLTSEGERAKKLLDGAVIYAAVWDLINGADYFYGNLWGIPEWVVTINYVKIMRKEQLPELRKMVSAEDYAMYDHALTNCNSFRDLVTDIYVPNGGYESYEEWFTKNSMAQGIENIKVPTFGFTAADDIIVDEKVTPNDAIKQGKSSFMMAKTTYGAHASHLTGTLVPRCWYPVPCAEFLNFIEDKLSSTSK